MSTWRRASSRLAALALGATAACVTASDPKQIPAASSTATAVVSAPASTTKVEPSITLRDAATVLAVVISLFSLWRTSRKEKRERLQSIDDDYWIRSVIGPIALEPMIKDVLEIVSNLPAAFGSPGYSKEEFIPFVQGNQPKIQQHVHALHALALVDQSLCKKVLESMDAIDEGLVEYCGKNHGGASGHGQKETQGKLRAHLTTILGLVRDYQMLEL
jgi:hypothetical protein